MKTINDNSSTRDINDPKCPILFSSRELSSRDLVLKVPQKKPSLGLQKEK